MYGILGENDSDVETLKVIVRRLLNDPRARIQGKGFDGHGNLIKRGEAQLRLFAKLDCSRFIVCADADGHDPKQQFEMLRRRVVVPAGVEPSCCIVIPVQELEAWLLADLEAIRKIIPSWREPPRISNPESISAPKEHLERLSRNSNRRPLYSHATHNPRLAEHIDLQAVRNKCPSFAPLDVFVRGH